jgi:tetratricopeptide (TPR) repeat protein
MAAMKVDLRINALIALVFLVVGPGAHSQDVEERVRLLDTEARAEEKQGHPDAAIQKYQEIVKLSPQLPAAYNNLGRLLYQQGRFREAIESLQRASELDPSLEAPRAQLGFCFFQMDDFANARREFEAALKLNPGDGIAKLFLARSLLQLNDVKGALMLLDELQQADPNNVEVLFTLGWAHAGLAVSTLNSIQKIDPNSYLIEVLQGKYAEVKQVYPEAVVHYKKAIAKAPDQPELYYCYAHVLYASGDFQQALQEYRRTLEMNPYDYRASWEAARIVLPDNPGEALRLASRALELKPDIAEAITIRGRALLALGRPAEAIGDFKKAVALDPKNPANHFQLARAYDKLGRTQDAQAETAIYERMQREAHFPSAGEETQAIPH